ncbi:MAG TPA: DUF6510 family protein [Solirubrobacteraceae bacterium]|nr:DUF6510 family protein [Solirubrobacteraceae bacterium]
MEIEEMRVDGNAAGGALSELFGGVEMTTAVRTCPGCVRTSTLAEHVVYTQAAGMVLRCPHCGDVGLTLISGAETRIVTLEGTLRVPAAG